MAASNWSLTEKGLKRVLVFKSFTELTKFLEKLGPEADTCDHHPDLRVFRATHLEIHLVTHDVGKVTEKDEALANVIDQLAKDFVLIPG